MCKYLLLEIQRQSQMALRAAKRSHLVRTAIWAKVCFRLSGRFSQWCSSVLMQSGSPSCLLDALHRQCSPSGFTEQSPAIADVAVARLIYIRSDSLASEDSSRNGEAHLCCFQSTLAASLIVAGGVLGAHAFNAAHSSLWLPIHAAFCAFLEEYLANLHPVHLQNQPHYAHVKAVSSIVILLDIACRTHTADTPAVYNVPVKLFSVLKSMMTSRCSAIVVQNSLVRLLRVYSVSWPEALGSLEAPSSTFYLYYTILLHDAVSRKLLLSSIAQD